MTNGHGLNKSILPKILYSATLCWQLNMPNQTVCTEPNKAFAAEGAVDSVYVKSTSACITLSIETCELS